MINEERKPTSRKRGTTVTQRVAATIHVIIPATFPNYGVRKTIPSAYTICITHQIVNRCCALLDECGIERFVRSNLDFVLVFVRKMEKITQGVFFDFGAI